MGTYCSCARPYPDPDATNEVADDTMIQCIICEDWYHSQHCLKYLNVDIEASEEDHELICGPCMSRLDFLGHYSELSVKPVLVDVETVNKEADKAADAASAESSEVVSNGSDGKIEVQVEETSKDSGVDCTPGSDGSSNTSVCPLVAKPKQTLPFSDVNAIVWKGSIRSALCRCSDCVVMYKTLNIEFILDEEDTIDHHEALGKINAEAVELRAEATINDQINQLGRVGQLEFLHGVNQFKEQLADFLKGHAEKGTVVQKEDVSSFFAKVKEEQVAKRRRLE